MFNLELKDKEQSAEQQGGGKEEVEKSEEVGG